ncbi:hypothetical protein Ahy_A05g022737 [Arachis hypogaea]|uniref:Aminotransferase-like plant mobile domain-containing protein n=1 Tax=Arachis hypogaea TaxID=3818 RepID=A0A445D1H0_ARAHY|nr:hypothetical protein Ahy_A05g022737 [Arachis hypogaea]
MALFCVWTWERFLFLAPVRSQPSFSLTCNWITWCSQFHGYKKWTILHIRHHERIENIVVPNKILQHRLHRVPLISFECIEWHPLKSVKRQFDLQESTRLAEAHNVVLTRPKNKNWRDEHSAYIMRWTNRLTSILVGDHVVHSQASKEYMQWYNDIFGAHLRLTGYSQPRPQPQSQSRPQPQLQPIMYPYTQPYTHPYTEPGASFFSQLIRDSHSFHMPPYQAYYRPSMS